MELKGSRRASQGIVIVNSIILFTCFQRLLKKFPPRWEKKGVSGPSFVK